MTIRPLGWRPDLPDWRDYTAGSAPVAALLARSQPLRRARQTLPACVDLRKWCSPIEDQGNLGSCTAQAGVGLMEYYQRRAYGHHLDGSRRFLYYATRRLMGETGDSGAYLRSTMKAMALHGIPPEEQWPYLEAAYDSEPPASVYALALAYRATTYYRLDPAGLSADGVLREVKTSLAANLPAMFGFSVYSSIPGEGEGTGNIPVPQASDHLEGGHAVVAVGYDDSHKVGAARGALLIRNSWSTGWGEGGYGWLPYLYVTRGLAVDWWTLVQADFVDTAIFE